MPSRLSGFHDGEVAMHELLKVPNRFQNPTSPGLPPQYAMRAMASPIMAIGTLDDAGRPWTTIWGGEQGFVQMVARDVLGINSMVDRKYDPVANIFWDGSEVGDGGVVQPGGARGKIMAALSIDLETRDRLKLAGRMVAGAETGEHDGAEVQMAMHVTESLGNCPKYLNKKEIHPHTPEPELVSQGLPLPIEARRLIDKADMFFLSSTNGETMDTNHRGGSPGFVRVARNEQDGVVLVYPEFSGNRLYQTLGNLKVNPRVGIAIPDFETSDVLYLTGSTSILVGEEASALLPRTNVAVQITVTDARFVKSGLPFRGIPIDHSPYNPPLRRLHTEQDSHIAASTPDADVSATLTRREPLTPNISRFTFSLSPPPPTSAWRAGQYVTLDFADELDHGYSHMRDDDPQSLNDDFVRTFTISSGPSDGSGEFQITARKNGPATGLLWRTNMRVGLELPVLGFGGEEKSLLPTSTTSEGKGLVFMAGGVGITPLLAQAQTLLDAAERGEGGSVLWSLRREDLDLAVDSFERIPGLAGVTRLFVTGEGTEEATLAKVKELGASVEQRRIDKGDVEGLTGKGARFFLCANAVLLKRLNEWLGGEDVSWEDFGY